MVLKKSNSCLNSGATQRMTGGKVVVNKQFSRDPKLLSLSIRLQPRPLGKSERPLTETVSTGLRLLEDYLAWVGPSRFQNVFANEPGRLFSRRPVRVHCGIDSNKTWRVHQRLKTMMSDQEFLRHLSSYGSVEVEENQSRPVGYFSASRKKTWRSAEAIARSSDPSVLEVTNKDVRCSRNLTHPRGVQRSHLWKEKEERTRALRLKQRKNGDNGVSSREKSGAMVVSFNVNPWQRPDVRWADSNYTNKRHQKRYWSPDRVGRSVKVRACKLGERGCGFVRLHKDEMGAEEGEMKEENDDNFLVTESGNISFESEESDAIEESCPTERCLSLGDFINPVAGIGSRRKRRKKLLQDEDTSCSVEPSSQGHHLCPKGSYTYVTKEDALSFLKPSPELENVSDKNVLEDIETLSDKDLLEDEEVDDTGSWLDLGDHIDKLPDELCDYNTACGSQTQSALEKEADDMRADFMDVLLQESEDDLGLFVRRMSSSSQSWPRDQEMLIDKRTVYVGRTQPPCFLVQLQAEDTDEETDSPACLVVKGHASSENNSASLWSVNIGADISAEHSKILNYDFRASFANLSPSDIRLYDLVTVASECVTRFYDQEFKSQAKSPATILSPNKNAATMKNTVSSCLRYAKCGLPCTCVSVKEAYRMLNTTRRSVCVGAEGQWQGEIRQEGIWQEGIWQEGKWQEGIRQEEIWQEYEMVFSTECEICLLSIESVEFLQLSACGHSFCVPCWSSHVLRLLQDGASRVLCMASGCSSEVTKAVMSTLVPYRLVCQWAERVRDKFLEAHPSCKWCPRQGCQRLAVLDQGGISSLPGQVSDTVTCPCGNTWCFGCQGDLHWPASCDQMAAYNHFRSHLDSTSQTGFGRVIDFVIELKPCPVCKYPIEKNQGCPSMVCRMCWTNFCWKCLQVVSSTHNVYGCTGSESSTTYRLTNRLANDSPIRYYQESVHMDNMFSKICGRKVRMWLESRQNAAKIPKSSPSRQERDVEALRLATESLDFLKNAYVFLEFFYLLMSFVYHNKTEISKAFMGILIQKVSNVEFIAGRLDTFVICRSRSQILTSRNTVRMLLVQGQRHVTHLVKHVTYLQCMTDKVETEWIKKLDPKKYMRYK